MIFYRRIMRIDIPLTRFPRKLRFSRHHCRCQFVYSSLFIASFVRARNLKIRTSGCRNNLINNLSGRFANWSSFRLPYINIAKTIDNSLRTRAKFTREIFEIFERATRNYIVYTIIFSFDHLWIYKKYDDFAINRVETKRERLRKDKNL